MKSLKYLICVLAVIWLLIPTLTFGQEPTDTTKVEQKDASQKTQELLQRLVDEATKSAVQQDTDPVFVDLEIDELLVNEMRTKAGNDFFDLFNSKWSWPDAEGDFIILFTERPFRTNTTQLQVYLNDIVIVENFLQPRSTYLEELADYTIAIATQYIVNYRQLVEDLDSGDQSGTGIY